MDSNLLMIKYQNMVIESNKVQCGSQKINRLKCESIIV